jgi:hypothetical protein
MLLCSATAGGWSKERELGLGLAEIEEAGDDVCGAGNFRAFCVPFL